MKPTSKSQQETSWATFLYKGVIIDPDCKVTYGENVKIMPLVSIGHEGFGFEKDGEGYKIPITRRDHPFGVFIGNDVEIGSQTVIHRGRWRDTVIGEGCKIDSLVHIAHNVVMGKHNLIVAGTVIGGSVTIGDNCFIGENVSIKQGIKIADHVTIGMGSVVRHDINESNTTWAGNPCVRIADVQKF